MLVSIEMGSMLKNAKDIKRNNYIRAGNEALKSIRAFREEFANHYKNEGMAEQLFDFAEAYMTALIGLKEGM